MSSYTIKAEVGIVAIEITGVAGRQAELLEAFGECQRGQCSCPTNEYEKVAAMAVEPADDRIDIRLEAKPATTLDASEIEACLDYTVGRATIGR